MRRAPGKGESDGRHRRRQSGRRRARPGRKRRKRLESLLMRMSRDAVLLRVCDVRCWRSPC